MEETRVSSEGMAVKVEKVLKMVSLMVTVRNDFATPTYLCCSDVAVRTVSEYVPSPTMEKGSENSGSSESKSMENVPYLGTILTLPIETTVGKGSFENKTRVAFSDKQTGSYGRATATEKVIGDKSGYTEVYNEQRVRNVSFNNNNDNKNNDNKNVIAYDHGYGDEHGGYGYDSDSDNGDGVEYGGYVYYSDSDSDY
ncbi:unnamed protein product [Lactuca virosa]|uniref:Uncharacterized protein n=1 Tax=Lactuca virosa TaxID=75947 RepID=A0AAU9NMN2_9ASTR|nr:unnamed protein product [Lactuca virosa]